MEIRSKVPINWPQAKKILEEKEKEKELGYEQKNALEYLRRFCKISIKNANQLTEELKKIEKLNETQIINIVNLLPKNLDDLRVLFANEKIDLSQEEKNKILEIVKNFAKEE